MSQYLIDCNGQSNPKDPVCTMSLFHAPPDTVTVYAFTPNWVYLVAAAVVLVFIVAVAVVRVNAHDEKNKTERFRIEHPPKQCPTCGVNLEVI